MIIFLNLKTFYCYKVCYLRDSYKFMLAVLLILFINIFWVKSGQFFCEAFGLEFIYQRVR